MVQKTIKIFVEKIYTESPKKKYPTNKTDVYHIDDIWSLDIIDLKGYGPGTNRNYRYVLVVKDNFSEFRWTVPLKNKNAQIIKESFVNILKSSKRDPNLVRTDRGKDFYNNIFSKFFKKIITLNTILEKLP